MVALANVALTDTFDTWRIRTNQIIVKGNEDELTTTASFAKANVANVLAFNTGTGANAFTSATIAGANTAVGTGANTYLLAVIAGANTAVGTGANAFTSATISGANTAVGTGANTISIAAFAKANAALANTTGTVFEGILYITANLGIGLTTTPAARLHVVGDIVATGDITSAYSDERLKDILEPVQNATSKILTLDTFYYKPNQTALDLGLNNERHIGLSAQQVQRVVSEVVKKAPIGNDYLTVQYERLVPLLIASIKELTERIEILENGTQNWKCNCSK